MATVKMKDLLLDIRYALRVLGSLPRSPRSFTHSDAGDWANVVVFGVVNAVLLHPLDVERPAESLQLRIGSCDDRKLLTTSYPAFVISGSEHPFSDIAGFMDSVRRDCTGRDA